MATILAVDDMRSMRDLVKSVLEKKGHAVTTHEDGVQALEFAKSNKVDLVISDINMPNMTGIQLASELRKLPSYAKTPILMLTTEDAQDKKQQAKASGANGWIQKPFNPERLLTAVSKTLGV
ncbi:MAG: response regulator [Gammaproteobacteria bacterium]|nr:response regulator [Gammaproteobacteria bacterium]